MSGKKYKSVGLSAILNAAALTSANAYEADNANTATLWQITDKEERVRVDSARRDWYYGGRMDVFLDEKVSTGGVVFLGDSITDRFPIGEVFPKGLKGKPVYNRGIGGDRIEGVLERLDVSVIDLQPSELHVLIGGNDVSWPVDYTKGNLKVGYERLFKSLKILAPKARIYAYTLPPLDAYADRLGTGVKETVIANKQLKDVCQAEGIECRDLYASLATSQGHFKPGLTTDGIHLSKTGYLNWIDLMFPDINDRFVLWQNIADKWSQSPTAKVSGTNVGRGENMLVIFQKDKHTTNPTTLTNEWGTEALVKNGVVAEIAIGGNMSIPEAPDYVLSGHGVMSDWIRVNCALGATATMSPDGKEITIKATSSNRIIDRYAYLRGKMLLGIARTRGENNLAQLKTIAKEINGYCHTGMTAKQMKEILAKIESVGTK